MNPSLIKLTLATMTRPELSAVAKKLGLKVGKSRKDTEANLTKAIQANQARFTVQFTIRSNANPDRQHYPDAIYIKKLRQTKDDKVVVSPLPIEPVTKFSLAAKE